VEGILLRVDSLMIASLVGPDGNFTVEDVTELVHADKPLVRGKPDIVRTYIGRPESIMAAPMGRTNRTAVIAADFLKEVIEGMHSYDLTLRSTFDSEPAPDVKIIGLIRQPRRHIAGAIEGRSAEQG
jgi:hypothetical protein